VTFEDVLAEMAAGLARATAAFGRRVDVAALNVTDRTGLLQLDPPTRVSPNRACRMVRAADGWIAVNLARPEDRDLVPAWMHGDFGEEPWAQIERRAHRLKVVDLVEGAALLGLPAGAVGEVAAPAAMVHPRGPARPRSTAPTVVDLSALWAGRCAGRSWPPPAVR
jgi:hypothetical protein